MSDLEREIRRLQERLRHLEGLEYVARAGTLLNANAEIDADGHMMLSGSIKESTAIGARVYRKTDQTIANDTATAVSFSDIRFDDSAGASAHWAIGTPTRLTCRVAGVYVIVGQARFTAHATGFRQVTVRLDAATVIAAEERLGTATTAPLMTAATVWKLGVGDYLEMTVYQNSGGDLTLDRRDGYSPEFAMVRVP